MSRFSIGIPSVVLLTFLMTACGSSRKAQSPNITTQAPSFKIDSMLTTKLGLPVPQGANPALVYAAAEWVGVPYKYGGSGKSGTDCSGLISNIYPLVYAVHVPRTTVDLFKSAVAIQRTDLKEGDLVFFSIETKHPGHSGIFLWHDYFLHASTSRGVIISSLNEPYWRKYFAGAGRIATAKP